MTDDRPPYWKLLVLAYADGELDGAKRREVEAWIGANPEAADLLRELRETGKGGPFRAARMPEPRPDDLTLSGERILARLQTSRPRRRWLRPAVLSGVAASMVALLVVAYPPEHVCVIATRPVEVVPSPADPLADFDDLPIASPSESRVTAISGDVMPTFVACEDLLPELLEFATVEEMQIRKTGRSALSMPGPDDAPMIYLTQSRTK